MARFGAGGGCRGGPRESVEIPSSASPATQHVHRENDLGGKEPGQRPRRYLAGEGHRSASLPPVEGGALVVPPQFNPGGVGPCPAQIWSRPPTLRARTQWRRSSRFVHLRLGGKTTGQMPLEG